MEKTDAPVSFGDGKSPFSNVYIPLWDRVIYVQEGSTDSASQTDMLDLYVYKFV